MTVVAEAKLCRRGNAGAAAGTNDVDLTEKNSGKGKQCRKQ
jgi:hypothetical protein